MLFKDTYKTIRSSSQGIYRDKGSRFLAFAHPIASADQVKNLIDSYRKEYHDARHHCYAYMLGYDKSTWRSNDDGEPSGTAGKPILGQINSHDLTNVFILVVRYFGGTLLGVSGLIHAYRSASADAINNSEIIECIVRDYFKIRFNYIAMNEVMKIVKDENLQQSDQSFGLDCSLKIGIRISRMDQLVPRFTAIENLKMDFIERY
jgi:uncharacterized YigZ family protein